ncbi:MAG TPA: S53 family peptidase [Marmoricola sp.]|nr:S53 family peptidase [Marmoricola sp.]
MLSRKISATLVAGATLVAAALAAGGPAQAAQADGRKAVPHTKPQWLAHADHLGAAKSSAAVQARVYLAPHGGLDALKQAALAVSTPGSATYHHFLTPAQYRAAYAPTATDVSAVRSWLTGAGLHVDGVAPGSRYLSVSGTVGGAEKAFGTQIGRFVHNGTTVQAPTSALTVPAALASKVLTVSGIDTTPHVTKPKVSTIPSAFVNARPCSAYYGQVPAAVEADGTTPLPKFNGATLPYAVCGYNGSQFRGAYEGGTRLSGSGVTVAITDAYGSTTMQSDASTYAARNGDAPYARGQYSQVVAKRWTNTHLCDPAGWSGEQTLDVEAVHAMAQGANIRYYGAASCLDADLLDTLGQVVDENIAKIVTNSWGDLDSNETADNIAAYEQIFLQGAMQGISFLFSSGDNGDELANSGVMQTDYPASDPYVTAVGGTSTAIGAANGLSWQTGWGTEKYSLSADGTSWTSVGFMYGAGGGQSALFPKPAYQSSLPGTQRSVPDLAMDADPTTGMLVGQTQLFPHHQVKYGEYRIGGTSLASPLFAGMTALALQDHPEGQGLLNPVIYGSPNAFTDVSGPGPDAGNVRVDYANGVDGSGGLLYSVRTFDQDSSLTVTPGWDDVTGLGSPNATWFKVL